ncbi:hypothetical protein FD754_016091 [Muntiacus muntjak]|uniref:U1 small nuclear ribonucleoprotein of 70kDa N-terminal domain-containing protein n=1 Tax=Muntiacus muntjak TaxID=9888 RepID=A0A5N3VQ34_MUNMU|nr:hypothetical protein FD754_016091 [Muntiacus muntjak]
MTQFLPPNLLALFAPRDPIPYLPPLEKLPHEKHHNQPYCGIAPYIREFENCPGPQRASSCLPPSSALSRREKIERRQQEVETELKMCKSLSSFHVLFKMLAVRSRLMRQFCSISAPWPLGWEISSPHQPGLLSMFASLEHGHPALQKRILAC